MLFANTGARIETVNDIEISGRNSTRMEVFGGAVVAAGTSIVVGEGPGGTSILNIDGGSGNTLTEVSATELVAGANGGTGQIIVAGFANLRANSFTAPTPEPTANGILTIEDNASADFANVSLGNTGRGLLEIKRGGILDASISVIVLGRGHLAVVIVVIHFRDVGPRHKTFGNAYTAGDHQAQNGRDDFHHFHYSLLI